MDIEEIAFKLSCELGKEKLLRLTLTNNIQHDTQNIFERILKLKESVHHVIYYNGKPYQLPHIDNLPDGSDNTEFKNAVVITKEIYYIPEIYTLIELNLLSDKIKIIFAWQSKSRANFYSKYIFIKIKGEKDYLSFNDFMCLVNTLYKPDKFKKVGEEKKHTNIVTPNNTIIITHNVRYDTEDTLAEIIIHGSKIK